MPVSSSVDGCFTGAVPLGKRCILCSSATDTLAAGVAGSAGATSVATCASIWRSVGKSKTSVSGSSAASPSRAVSRLRSSTAPRESSPASISGASADALGSSSAATSRSAAVTSTAL